MRKILKYLKPFKIQLIFGPAAKFTEALFELITPLLIASLIDNGVKTGDGSHVIRMSIYIAAVSIIGFFCALFCQYSASLASQGFGTALRNGMIEKIGTLSYADFEHFGSQGLSSRVTGDVNQLQLGVAMLIRLVVRAPFLCIGGVIMAIGVNRRLGLILLLFIPLFIALLYVITVKTIPIYKKIRNKLEALAVVIKENFTGVRVVRAFDRAETEKKRFAGHNSQWLELSVKAGWLSAALSPVTTLIMNAAIVCIVYFGGRYVNSDMLTQGELVAFINYATQIMLALIVVSNLGSLFNRSAASAGRVSQLLDYVPTVAEGAGAENRDKTRAVSFEDVSFSYGEGAASLSGISFEAMAGQTVGIIGGTGSGKTTLLNLISRLYDADSGQVKIEGADIRSFKRSQLLETVAVASQKASLFSGTIASNLRMGKSDAAAEDMERAAEIAQAKEFIDALPDRFDTPVVQGGLNFSGGQRQRLAVARSVIGEKPILVLDDCSSALDYATDLALRRAVSKLECTVFVSSQRVASVKDADFILVLDEGELKGKGTHTQLLSDCDTYQEICRAQNIGRAFVK